MLFQMFQSLSNKLHEPITTLKKPSNFIKNNLQ